MTDFSKLTAVGAYDGRYKAKTNELRGLFSTYAFTRNRLLISSYHFQKLIKTLKLESQINIDKCYYFLAGRYEDDIKGMTIIGDPGDDDVTHYDDPGDKYIGIDRFILEDVEDCLELEKETNHDVAAIIKFLKQKYRTQKLGPEWLEGYFHLGLTSQDLNTTAIMMSVESARGIISIDYLDFILDYILKYLITPHKDTMILGKTHGQVATPTTIGNIFQVFYDRILSVARLMNSVELKTKFGGATGGFNSLKCLDTGVDWHQYADELCAHFDLKRAKYTSQIEGYDSLCSVLRLLDGVNTVLIDMCQDIWLYISRDIFKLAVVTDEVGSSAMPHKVNPIDFENAMGNLRMVSGLISAMVTHLPTSFMQRDLKDSTMLRQLGNIFSGCLVSYKAIIKGLNKLSLNEAVLQKELDDNIVVVVEGIQTLLRFCGSSNSYDDFKALTRGKQITKDILLQYVDNVEIKEEGVKLAYQDKKTVDDVRTMMRNMVLDCQTHFNVLH